LEKKGKGLRKDSKQMGEAGGALTCERGGNHCEWVKNRKQLSKRKNGEFKGTLDGETLNLRA